MKFRKKIYFVFLFLNEGFLLQILSFLAICIFFYEKMTGDHLKKAQKSFNKTAPFSMFSKMLGLAQLMLPGIFYNKNPQYQDTSKVVPVI